jgi:hypothetical protein
MARKEHIHCNEECQNVAESHNHCKFVLSNAETTYKLFEGTFPDSNRSIEASEATETFITPGRKKGLKRSYAVASLIESNKDYEPPTEHGCNTDTFVDTDIDNEETPKTWKSQKSRKFQ